jgi:hypothetical protein
MEKKYIKGSIRARATKFGDTQIIASLSLKELSAIANDRGFVNIIITPRKEEDQYGNTHYAFENKPSTASSEQQQPAANKPSKPSSPTAKAGTPLKSPNFKEAEPTDDMPF